MQGRHDNALDEELQEGDRAEGPAEEEEESFCGSETGSRGRGRPAVPVCWSRVLHITADSPVEVKAHQVAVDIMVQKQLRDRSRTSNNR